MKSRAEKVRFFRQAQPPPKGFRIRRSTHALCIFVYVYVYLNF